MPYTNQPINLHSKSIDWFLYDTGFYCISERTVMYKLCIVYVIKVCLEMPFSKNMFHVETIQLIYFANQLAGSYMMGVFTERYFQTDYRILKKHYVKCFSGDCNITYYDNMVKCDGQVS